MTAWWPGPRRPHLQTVTKMWVQLESQEMVLRIRGCGVGGLGGAPARHRPPALGSGAPCPAPHQGLLRRVLPVGPGFWRPPCARQPSLGCKPPQTRLTQLFCGDRARHRGLAVPSRGLARRWLGLLGWAGGRPAAVHGVAQASQACGSVPRSLPGHSLGGAGLRPRLSRGDSREGGRRWGKCRRGRETEGDRQDGETGRRAGRREPDGGSACSPLPPGCKAEWRLTAVRHPRTGFKVTTQISLRSGR